MAGIQLIQNGVVYNATGAVHPAPLSLVDDVLCYLSAPTVTTTTYQWAVTVRPTNSTAVISSALSPGPTFRPDIAGGGYTITLTDDLANVYVIDINLPSPGIPPGTGGGGTSVESIAALRLISGVSASTVVTVKFYSVFGDGGGGTFIWDPTSVETDNSGTIIQATGVVTGRWKRQYSGAMYAAWWGVKADGIQLSDGDFTINYLGTGHARLTSASGRFTASMVGQSYLGRTPSNPIAGTVAMAAGNRSITGTGTAFLTDIPNNGVGGGAAPNSGGAIYVFNTAEYLAINLMQSNTAAILSTNPGSTHSAATIYTETQLASTVFSYVSATEIRVTAPGVISRNGQVFAIGTDNSVALKASIDAAFALKVNELILPDGLIGVSQNFTWTGKGPLTIRGGSTTRTVIMDLRLASAYPALVGVNYGCFSFYQCAGIVLQSISYDGNLPILGLQHTTPGTRQGFMFRDCVNSKFIDCGDGAVSGARDEHLYSDGDCPNVHYDRCNVLKANSNAINPGSGPGQSYGTRVTNCVAVSAVGNALLLGAASAVVMGNTLRVAGLSGVNSPGGSDVAAFGTYGNMIIAGNNFVNSDISAGGVSGITFFGTPGSNGNLQINNNIFDGLTTGWAYAGAGCITLKDFHGSVSISGNQVDNCTASQAGGRFVFVSGSTTSKVVIGPNYFGGVEGSNMTIGIEVDSTVPAGVVTILPGSVYGPAVMQRLKAAVACSRAIDLGGTRDGATLRDVNQILMCGEYAATFTASGSTLTATAHTLLVGDTVTFTTTTTLPAGLVSTAKYYVTAVATNTFSVALTPGGTAITTTTGGTGTHTFHRAGGHKWTLPEATMTANRSDTLSTAGSPAPTADEVVEIERRDATGFTRAIFNGGPGAGTLYTFPASDTRLARFRFDGTNWLRVDHNGINP